nr:DnaA N-terminal domain-containing protein [Rickettsia tamurae]
MDKAWFSKAAAVGCRETSTLKLTMPTRCMADWIKNNYSHVIKRLANGYGINSVEYGYDKVFRDKLYNIINYLTNQEL